MGISIAGVPPRACRDVLLRAPRPVPVPAPMPRSRRQAAGELRVARKFNFAFDTNIRLPRPREWRRSAPTLAGGGSEAASKLESEYWDLKGQDFRKKAEALGDEGEQRRGHDWARVRLMR